MPILAKNGLFAVSLCALSVSVAVKANNTQLVKVGGQLQTVMHTDGMMTNFISITDKNGNLISNKIRQNFIKNRYIVELNSEPLIQAKKEILRNVSLIHQASNYSGKTKAAMIKSRLQQVETTIATEQLSVSNQIRSIAKSSKIIHQFSRTNNALVIEADSKYLDEIKQLANVKRVSLDTIKYIDLAESVPLINAPLVWAMQDNNVNDITGKGVVVAILDTGIDYNHIDLGGCIGSSCRVTHGYDFINNDNDPMDGHGHGTHVAGIVGANGTLKGVAPDVTFHAYKVLSDQGSGSSSGIIAALERSVDPDGDINTDDAVDIVNMSLGGGGNATDPLSIATNNTVDAGVIVVVAAGNDGNYGAINSSSPASAEKAITVASSTKSDELSGFSSKAIATAEFTKPEITAPGSNINSTVPGGGQGVMSGTSMAAPHVAGAVALIKQKNPNLSADKAVQLLGAGAIDLGIDPLSQGPGRMDIEKSINATSTASATALNFGTIDIKLAQWSSTQPLTIYNDSNEDKTYQVDFTEGLPSGAEILSSESSFSVAANSSHTFDITINVANVSALDFATNGGGVHYNAITITSDTDTLRVPAYFEHAIKLTLRTNAPGLGVWAYIVDPANNILTIDVTSEKPVEIRITDPDVWFGAFYMALDGSNLPIQSNVYAYKIGLSSHKLTVTENQDFLFDVNELTKLSGLNQAAHQGGSNAINDIYASARRVAISSGAFTFSTQSSSNYKTTPFVALGNIAENDTVEFDVHYIIDEPNNEHVISRYIYESTHSNSSITDELFGLDLATTPFIDIQLEDTKDSNNYLLTDTYFGVSATLPINTKQLKVYETNHNDLLDFKQFTAFYQEPNVPDIFERIKTPYFDLDSNGQLRHSSKNYNYLTTSTQSQNNVLDLSGSNIYFNGMININENTVNLSSANWLHRFIYTDQLGNMFDIEGTYAFYCQAEDGTRTDLSQGTFDNNSREIAKPKESCDNLLLNFSYNNHFSGQGTSSVISLNVTDLDTIPPIDSIKLKHNNHAYSQPIINKIDSVIELSSTWWLDIKSIELRLNNGDWQTLNFETNEFGMVVVPMPLIDGEYDADLKITSQSSTLNQVSHSLNSFFKFGASAGESNDADNDGISNEQDPDDDNDGYNDDVDAFPYNSKEWLDSDSDGTGDNADTDDDNDGYLDNDDAFPLDSREWLDTDGDGIGNNTDTDDDNDGVADTEDEFPLDSSEFIDSDGDGVGNNADIDDDNDGYLDEDDAFPLDSSEWLDSDGDGIGNNADTDDDNDGVSDTEDAFPLNASESIDTDGDGIGNNADTDDDNDGVSDTEDAFPLNASESIDTDGDSIGNNADIDDDNDGYLDEDDAFPLNSSEWLDTDGDGIGNNADTDDDNDGIADSNDSFPLNRAESIDTDEDGIGNNADTDDDNDGVADAVDAFPLDSSESVDTDGDGIGNNADTDDDGDGIADSQDAYPLDANKSTLPSNKAADDSSTSSSGGSIPLFGLLSLFSAALIRRIKR